MAGEVVVFVTCPGEVSEVLAKALVEKRLAACVNVVAGVKSIYSWKGQTVTDQEDMLIIKSHKSLWADLEPSIKALHPYEVPEMICFSIEEGHKPYLDWICSTVAPISD
jgi:periplasmic divalent cation tolerance protein